MSDNRFAKAVATASPLLALLAINPAQADAPEATDGTPEQVVITGTRVENRSAMDSAVPVDVISADALQNVGVTEVSQALSTALPSYNFPRPGLADGTDSVRPASLRGLAPDQTLVLVNGKRRHAAALVNLNGTIGRGSSAADLNTIPAGILKSVEVLRDGASAQYGSDAIAGVINLRLREDRDGGEASVTYGVRDTSFDVLTGATTPANAPWAAPPTLTRNITDGDTLTASVWKGLSLGDNGFVTISAEYKDQDHTERGGYDARRQYPLLPGDAFDPREQTFNRFNSWYGEPELSEKTLFVNSGYDLSGGAKLYGWAGYQRRDTRGAGFYRRALDDRNVQAIYPDGFLPIIAPELNDYSAAAGVTWALGDWAMDTSLSYGLNTMDYQIENTLNTSIGPSSKTQFDSGGFDYDQLVFNVSGVRGFDVGLSSPLNVAIGLEARRESYSISAGEPDSYRKGDAVVPGVLLPPGAQVFPGFSPADEVDKSRDAVGAYVDLDAHFTEKLLLSAALRGENYSDFGSNLSGKLAGRYDFTEAFALRASVQNGFRAPSLQQQFFGNTATNNIGGVLLDVTTLPVASPVAQALGAKPLDAEESLSYTLGAVLRVGKLDITVDAYRVNIDDRIVLSENLSQLNVRNFLIAQGLPGVAARFFINGVDTETQGVDLAMSYPFDLASAGSLGVTFAANFNSTDVTKVPQTAPLAAISPSPPLFDRLNILTFEEGTPKNKFVASANWSRNAFGATLRATRYGDALSPDGRSSADLATATIVDVPLSAKTLVDLEARVTIMGRFKFAVGAENLFDTYPEPVPAVAGGNITGTTAFSNYSAFGRSGRFIYSRVSLNF